MFQTWTLPPPNVPIPTRSSIANGSPPAVVRCRKYRFFSQFVFMLSFPSRVGDRLALMTWPAPSLRRLGSEVISTNTTASLLQPPASCSKKEISGPAFLPTTSRVPDTRSIASLVSHFLVPPTARQASPPKHNPYPTAHTMWRRTGRYSPILFIIFASFQPTSSFSSLPSIISPSIR